jgi:hypothetical protein
MPVWKPDTVNLEPYTFLDSGAIFETPKKEQHIVGSLLGEGRVSSKIVNNENGVFTTQSGRKYKIDRYGIISNNAEYVLNKWLKLNNLTEKDIFFVNSFIKNVILLSISW